MVKITKLWLVGVGLVGAMLFGSVWMLASNQKARNDNPSVSQTSSDVQPSTTPAATALNPALVQNANQFAFNLFKELLNPQTERAQRPSTIVRKRSPNKVFSPLGVQYVLALFLNGAEAETYQEIAKALGLETVSLEEVNRFHLGVQQLLGRWQADEKLVLANSIWIHPSASLHPDFARVGRQFYGLEAYKVDFTNTVEAARRINEWGKQKTQGFVPEVVTPGEIGPDTILAVANALYLRGLWAQPFKVADDEMEFRCEDGSVVRVRPMEAELKDVLYGEVEGCRIVGLPYRGGDWLCYVVVPSEGIGVRDLVERLDGGLWSEWLGQLRRAEQLEVVLTRFEIESEYDLKPALRKLGIRRAFTVGGFPRILLNGDAGFIDLFKQVGRVRVDERGTEAGAATIAMTAAIPPPLVVDRSFLYVIAERSSGMILFMGVVHRPEG